MDNERGTFEVYTIMHHVMTVDVENVSPRNKRKCFTQCIISLWNSLPEDMVVASNLSVLKRTIDKLMEDILLLTYKTCLINRPSMFRGSVSVAAKQQQRKGFVSFRGLMGTPECPL